jgi:hypothetical protein
MEKEVYKFVSSMKEDTSNETEKLGLPPLHEHFERLIKNKKVKPYFQKFWTGIEPDLTVYYGAGFMQRQVSKFKRKICFAGVPTMTWHFPEDDSFTRAQFEKRRVCRGSFLFG